jgi:hypothetical protein
LANASAGGSTVFEVDRHQRPGEARILTARDADDKVASIGKPLRQSPPDPLGGAGDKKRAFDSHITRSR